MVSDLARVSAHAAPLTLIIRLTLGLSLVSASPLLVSASPTAQLLAQAKQPDALYQELKRLTRHPDPWARFGARAQALAWRDELTEAQLTELLASGREPEPRFAELKTWLQYQHATTHEPTALKPLGERLKLLSQPWVSAEPIDARAPLAREAWRALPPQLIGGLLSVEPWGGERLSLLWAWRHNPSSPQAAQVRALCVAHNAELSVWLNGDPLGHQRAPEQLWLDQSCWGLPLREGLNHLSLHLEGGGALSARLLNERGAPVLPIFEEPRWGERLEASRALVSTPSPMLWREAIKRVDHATSLGARGEASLSHEALLGVAWYAALAQVPEAERLSPVIEAHLRWERALKRGDERAHVRALESLEALTPQSLRAQTWGDYPPPAHVRDPLLKRHALRLWLSSLDDHLQEGRFLEARRALARAKALSNDDPRCALAEAKLLSELDMTHSAQQRLRLASERSAEPLTRARLARAEAALLWRRGARAHALKVLWRLSTAPYERSLRAPPSASYSEGDPYDHPLFFEGEARSSIDLSSLKAWLSRALELSHQELNELSPHALTRFDEALSLLAQGPFALTLPALRVELMLARELPDEARRALAHESLTGTPLKERLLMRLSSKSAAMTREAHTGERAPVELPQEDSLGPPLSELLSERAWGSWAAGRADDRDPPAARALYEHTHLELDEEGRLSRSQRGVLEVLNPKRAASLRLLKLPHRPELEELEILEAQLLREGELRAAERKGQEPLLDAEARLYYNAFYEVIDFGPLKAGDVLLWRWRSRERQPDPTGVRVHGDLIALQGGLPKATARLTLGPRARERFHLAVEPHGAWVERREGEVIARGLPASSREVERPKGASELSYVHVSVLSSWATVRALYAELLKPTLTPQPKLKALALAWTQGVKGEEAQLSALYAEVTRRVRYVGLEFGRHSFSPAPPTETLSRGFGDCKDRAALMIALAASLDIPLYFVMVRTSAAGRVEREGAASLGAFNHAALYSPRLKRFFDPTVSHHDTWALPHEDQGAQALLVDPLGAAGEPSEPSAPKQLTVIPYLKPSRELNSLSLSLETPARAQGAHADTEERRWTLTWSLWGVEAAQARQLLEGEGGLGEPSESSEGQLQERLKQWLMARLIELSPHASPSGLEVSGLTPARDPLTLSARLTLPSTTLSVHLEALLKGWRLLPKYAPTSQRRSPWRQRPVALELKVPELSAAALEPLRLPQAPPLSPLLPEGCCQVEASREGGEVRLRLSLSGGELSAAAYLARRRWLSEVEGELLRWAKAYEARWR